MAVKMQMNLDLLHNKFNDLFTGEPSFTRSPGRINLIGEHTDYNMGFVFPAAVDKEILFASSFNNENMFRFFAVDLDEYFEIETNKVEKSDVQWANYLLGVIHQFQKGGYEISGVDCVFGGNIPIGAGMSSSAALENGFAHILNQSFNLKIDKQKLIRMAQLAEHEYAGVKCGIMDQFASMFGKEKHAMLLDCRSLDYEYFPVNLGEYTLLLIDTHVSHNLASSEYNKRRNECEEGLAILNKIDSSIQSLRDASPAIVNENKHLFSKTVYKRCSYVVNENERVLKAAEYLKNDELEEFGELLYQTHSGLKENYEVSCKELDFLVDTAKETDYVIGARMMGGGFGGCTINVVRSDKIQDFQKLIQIKYKEFTGKDPSFYSVNITDGTGNLK